MADFRKILGLDLVSLKPYFTLKNLLILLVVSLVYIVFLENPSLVFTVSMVFALLFASYPFLIGENSGIDGLYRLFGLKPESVVVGRYISALILFILSFILGSIIYMIVSILRSLPIDLDLLLIVLSNFFIFSLIISFQYPIFFKYGYKKARIFAMVPMFFLGFVGVIGGMLGERVFSFTKSLIEFIIGHKLISATIVFIIFLLIAIISINLSIKFYKKRDL